MFSVISVFGCTLLALFSALEANAQSYPNRAVRMIVPLAPGGSVDTLARLLAQKMTESMGQQVVVDNRGGASGNIGTELAVRAPADGYTILTVSMTLVVNPFLFAKLPFDVVKDLSPISLIGAAPFVLVAHPSVPARSVGELIALAKKRPGTLNYASAGKGTNSHLGIEPVELKPDIRSKIIRVIMSAQRARDGDVQAFGRLLEVEAQILAQLRIPTEDEIARNVRHGVWPIAAIGFLPSIKN